MNIKENDKVVVSVASPRTAGRHVKFGKVIQVNKSTCMILLRNGQLLQRARPSTFKKIRNFRTHSRSKYCYVNILNQVFTGEIINRTSKMYDVKVRINREDCIFKVRKDSVIRYIP